eukprot:scaffold146071_cov39-Prasinocladus_malaysianus.AAC.1
MLATLPANFPTISREWSVVGRKDDRNTAGYACEQSLGIFQRTADEALMEIFHLSTSTTRMTAQAYDAFSAKYAKVEARSVGAAGQVGPGVGGPLLIIIHQHSLKTRIRTRTLNGSVAAQARRSAFCNSACPRPKGRRSRSRLDQSRR